MSHPVAHLDPEDILERNAALEPAPRKRKKSTSPTQRTLAECKRRGWIAQVVERWNPHAKVRQDLFGVIDLVAIVTGDEHPYDVPGIVGIQACAGASHAARRDKILAEPRARAWVEAGGRLELWSWSKRGGRHVERKLWTLRTEVFTRESWRSVEGNVLESGPLPGAFRIGMKIVDEAEREIDEHGRPKMGGG